MSDIITAFPTGSRVYGKPRPDSDIDLVVLMDGKAFDKLHAMAKNCETLQAADPEYADGRSLRFGSLNLLCVFSLMHFNVWKEGTEQLVKRAPVTRDEAIAFLGELRRKNHISGW